MRTTIQLADETKQALQALAEERGFKGISPVLEEAVRFYLAERNRPVVVAEPAAVPVVGRWERPAANLDLRPNQGTNAFAMHSLSLWGGFLGMFGFFFWSDLMRRSFLQRA